MANFMSSQKNQGARTSKTSKRTLTPSEQQDIQELAYQLFVNRGYQNGHDQEDWLKAEQIVRSRLS